MFKICDEPLSPKEGGVFKVYDEPEPPNEGVCVCVCRVYAEPNRQARAGVHLDLASLL